MKRFLPLTCAALLLAGVAVAQPSTRGHFGHMRGADGARGAERHERMLDRMSEKLGLSDNQKASAKELHEQLAKTVEPLFEQQRALHEQTQAALENGSDAAKVGALVISSYKNRQAIKAAHEDLQKDFEALLTAEQREKFQSFKGMHERHDRRGTRH